MLHKDGLYLHMFSLHVQMESKRNDDDENDNDDDDFLLGFSLKLNK